MPMSSQCYSDYRYINKNSVLGISWKTEVVSYNIIRQCVVISVSGIQNLLYVISGQFPDDTVLYGVISDISPDIPNSKGTTQCLLGRVQYSVFEERRPIMTSHIHFSFPFHQVPITGWPQVLCKR